MAERPPRPGSWRTGPASVGSARPTPTLGPSCSEAYASRGRQRPVIVASEIVCGRGQRDRHLCGCVVSRALSCCRSLRLIVSLLLTRRKAPSRSTHSWSARSFDPKSGEASTSCRTRVRRHFVSIPTFQSRNHSLVVPSQQRPPRSLSKGADHSRIERGAYSSAGTTSISQAVLDSIS
jgi:hypothetical protein